MVTASLNELGAEGWELVAVAPKHQSKSFGSYNYDFDELMFCAKRAQP
jgi:hypothetical protein